MRKGGWSFGGAWSVLLALGLTGTVAYAFSPRSSIEQTGLFAGVLGVAAIASVSGRRRAPAAERVAWLWTSVALCGFLAGDLVWWRFPDVALGPFATAADALFLLSCVPLAVAAALLGASREGDRDRLAWLDAGILTAVLSVVTWDSVVERSVGDTALSLTQKLVAVGHPIVDVLTIGLVLRLVLSRNGRDRSTVSFGFGAILMLATNLIVSGLNTGGSFRPGAAVGSVWLVSYLLLGFAAIQPPAVRAHSKSRVAMGKLRLAVVLLAVFVPEVVLARDLARHHLIGFDTVTIAVGVSTLVVALAAVRLRRSLEARLSALILHSTDAILLVDKDGRIAFSSPSARELLGGEHGALLGTSLLDSFIEEHRDLLQRQLDNVLAMPRGATVPLEGRARSDEGRVRVLEGVARNLLEDENVRAVVVTLRDTTSRRQLEQQLQRRAFQDGLTGLANRALFVDRVEHALSRSTRDDEIGIAVLFIDLDDFKAVNDGMGHAAGDDVIRGVAERIRSCVRPDDTVARLGGDEFTVLVEDIPSVSHVKSLAHRLLEVLQLPIDVNGVSLAVPASVGVTFATRGSTAESLLRDADIAMYSAKSQGKSRVVLFDATLRDVAVQRLALKVELPEALREGQFSLAYQPITDVVTNDLRGFEALVRWDHPLRGRVSPGEFIPAAEETGMIVDLGRWVLQEACRQAVVWNAKWTEPLSVNVNVSGLQLHEPRFIDDLRQVLEQTGLPPASLTLELTESVLVKHQRVESILASVRSLGVGIAIDDFGTGYSSLSYLQQFPVTCIKVDQSFVADLAARREVSLVRSILSIGDAFGLTTVAEGVETAEQLAVLKSLGCNRAQGFFLGRPQSAAEVDGMLEIARMARTARWRMASAVPAD